MIISINKILSKKLKINLVIVIHHLIKIHQNKKGKKKMNKMLMDKKRKRKAKEVNKNMKDFQN